LATYFRSHFGISSRVCSRMTSTARSSGCNDRSGATEHTLQSEWGGAFAYSNLGLPGAGFSGPHWANKHRPVLLKLFTELMSSDYPVLGLLLCEVGNLDDLLDATGKKRLEDVIREAFRAAGATEHGEPQFIWSQDETMAAFRADVQVRALDPLKKMKRVHAWRVVQRFEVTGATEHGPCSLLIYNTHQPKSMKRKFSVVMSIDFCKAVLWDAMVHVEANPSCCGFGFGGDANCTLATWSTAFEEMFVNSLSRRGPEYRSFCKRLVFMRGVGGLPGDLMVGAGMKGLDFYDNTCTVAGREPNQHQPMILEWCYRGQPPSQPTIESITAPVDKVNETDEKLWQRVEKQVGPFDSVEEAPQIDGEDSDSETTEDSVDFGKASEQSEESGAEEHADEISATGFALMKSALLLPRGLLKAKNCIDSGTLRTMHGACTPEDMTSLQECVDRFFSTPAVLQSTPPRQDAKAARMLKPSDEIKTAWRVIMEKRRLVEPDDRCAIQGPDTLKDMYNAWMHEWLDGDNLTSEQRRLKQNKKTSIFAAHLYSNFGGKHFVMALWQTGIQWAPTPEMIRDDYNGALEHVAKNFAKWTQRVARAITRHKSAPDTVEARRKSGQSYGKHGLSNEEERTRDERDKARRDYYSTLDLQKQLKDSKRKMNDNEWWWLRELRSGRLRKEMQRAEGKCHRVQANDFVVNDDD
jgi:hypothetical protein